MAMPSNFPFFDDLSMVTSRTDVYSASNTDEVQFSSVTTYHIPFLVWVIIGALTLYIFNRILLEFLIRWRK
jgi:uncharacterized protein with PQ loop repeat